MEYNDLLYTEGDINIGDKRKEWDRRHNELTRVLLDVDQTYFLHQSMSTPCLDVIEKCEGSYLINLEGKKYLDFHGNSVQQVGFKNAYVIEQIKTQLDELTFCTRRYTNKPAIKLARKLVEHSGKKLAKVLFAPGGALANGMALKLARAVTGRFKVVAFWDAFHGASLDTISVGGEAVFRKNMGPVMPGVERIPPPNTYRGILGSDEMKYADYFEYVVEKEGDIGAFIAEPIRNTDVIVPTKAFWQRIREICDKHGIFLIFDEIPTGLGRTGKLFVWEHYGVVPDAVTLGKGLGGGIFPLAAMLTKKEHDVAPEVSIGHYTHEKNPVAATAGAATLDYISNEKLLEKVAGDAAYLRGRFSEWKDRYPIVGDVRGLGMLWAIELVRDRKTKEKAYEEAESIMYGCLREGLNFKVSQGNVIQLSPPLTVTRDELDFALDILEAQLEILS